MYRNRKLTLHLFILISLLFTLFVYWFGYGKPTYGIDDANIYFVYMKNFATGHGFVWNVGGERVEGFTSLLWTLIGGLFYKLAGESYVWLLLSLNCVLTYTTIYRLLLFMRRLNDTMNKIISPTDIMIMSLLIFPLGFIEWSILSLMETGLWIFLIVNITLDLCNYYLLEKRMNNVLFCAMIFAMMLTRPESIIFALLFILIRFIQVTSEEGIKRGAIQILLPISCYVITLTMVTLWRVYYFGYPFPNTYYAKVSGSMRDNISGGLSYLFKFFYEYPQAAFAIGLLFISTILMAFKWKKGSKLVTNDQIQLILLAVLFTGLALPVLTGGDHFKFSRFYQCILPITYVAILNFPFWARHIGRLDYTVNGRTPALLTAIFVAGIFFIAKSDWYDLIAADKISANRILGDFQHARNGRASALGANETFEDCAQYPSVGILAAGGFGYIYKGDAIDLMGLNSTIMAHASRIKHGFRNHASFNENGFWKLLPDIVGIFYGGEIVRDTSLFVLPENTYEFRHGVFVYSAYKEIFDHPRFISTYMPALVRNKKENFYLFAYYSKKFLNKLDSSNFEILLLQRKYIPSLKH